MRRLRRLLARPTAPAAAPHLIAADALALLGPLGAGEFGAVRQGVWAGRQVAVKCLYRDQVHADAADFLKEAAIMHAIEHEAVVRLHGVVLQPALMLVTELAPLRSLLECLREPGLRAAFSLAALCRFAAQVAEGMAYLEAKRLIHRDLAARNVLVFSKDRVKISDFGLSRALGAGKDYYQTDFNVNLKLPVAWCAPECIGYLRFTSASDVWAYAVTLWEMFSYGFQPWAALSGREILVAIDAPECRRLERPDRCPSGHYALMLRCWAHDPADRPRFVDVVSALPGCEPERVRAVVDSPSPKTAKDLSYRAGDVISVLDKDAATPGRWRGTLASGESGLFDRQNATPFRGTSDFPGVFGAFVRNDRDRGTVSRRRLRGDMISLPRGEVKHTGHVGLDGAYFGDVSFLEGGPPPKQIVNPYKPSDDLEHAPLIDPNSPSHLTGNSALPPRAPMLIELPARRSPPDGDVEGSREYGNVASSRLSRDAVDSSSPEAEDDSQPHDYQEISDDDRRPTEFGQSLLDEMELMFRNYREKSDFSPSNRRDEADARPASKKKSSVKPISAHDSRTLDSAIALANKITVESMTDLDAEDSADVPPSPAEKSKFSFRFPSVGGFSGNSNGDSRAGGAKGNEKREKRNFSREAQSVPDIQTTLTDESKLAYESLVEQPCRLETTLLKMKRKHISPLDGPDRDPKEFFRPCDPSIDDDFFDDNKCFKALEAEGDRTDAKTLPVKSANRNGNLPNFESGRSHFPEESANGNGDRIDFDIRPSSVSKESTKSSNDAHRQSDSAKRPTGINLIPVPPRDLSKRLDAGKRHVRKHPLILQNSLEQAENFDRFTFPDENYDKNRNASNGDSDGFSPRRIDSSSSAETNLEDWSTQYHNVNSKYLTSNPFDTPSLHFEAQIENDVFSADCVDGMSHFPDFDVSADFRNGTAQPTFKTFQSPFRPFDQIESHKFYNDKKNRSLSLNEELEFIDDSPNNEFNALNLNEHAYDNACISSTGRTGSSAKNGLNSLMMNNLSKHSPDRVSVEDLLEFAGQKPCGRQRGVDSDEVRIMCKVLSQQVSPNECLLALEFASWNVHRAIKLAKLRFMGLDSPTLYECSVALEGCDWDVSRAATVLADSSDVTQV